MLAEWEKKRELQLRGGQLARAGRWMGVFFRVFGVGALLLLAASVWALARLYGRTDGYDPERLRALGVVWLSSYGSRAAILGAMAQSCSVLLLVGAAFLLAGAACAWGRGEHSPFRATSGRRLRAAAWLLLAACLLPQRLGSIVQRAMGGPGFSAVNLWGFLLGMAAAVFFFYLARVYEHGYALQEQSDETM